MTPRQKARQLLKPLVERPVIPQQIAVCDELAAYIAMVDDERSAFKSEVAALKRAIQSLAYDLRQTEPYREERMNFSNEGH